MPSIRSFTFGLLLVLAGHNAVKAQQTTPSAYIITTSSDTLQGEILKESQAKRVHEVKFRPQGGEAKTYSAAEIKGYGLSDGLRFEARHVVVSENPQTIFLQVLVDGPTKLYYAHDFHPSYAYFLQRQQEPVVPLHKSYYTGTLSALLQECSSLDVQKYKYNSSSLASMTHAYNNCRYAGQESDILHKQAKMKVKWGGQVAVHASQLAYMYEDGTFGNLTFDRKGGVTAGLFLNFGYAGKPLSIQPELLYTSRRASNTYNFTHPQAMNYESKVELEAHYLQLPILLRYQFSKGAVQPYVNAGVSYGLALSQEFSHTITFESGHTIDNEPVLDQYTLGYVMGAGVQFNKLSLDARFSRDLANSNHLENKIHFNTLQFGVGYTF